MPNWPGEEARTSEFASGRPEEALNSTVTDGWGTIREGGAEAIWIQREERGVTL